MVSALKRRELPAHRFWKPKLDVAAKVTQCPAARVAPRGDPVRPHPKPANLYGPAVSTDPPPTTTTTTRTTTQLSLADQERLEHRRAILRKQAAYRDALQRQITTRQEKAASEQQQRATNAEVTTAFHGGLFSRLGRNVVDGEGRAHLQRAWRDDLQNQIKMKADRLMAERQQALRIEAHLEAMMTAATKDIIEREKRDNGADVDKRHNIRSVLSKPGPAQAPSSAADPPWAIDTKHGGDPGDTLDRMILGFLNEPVALDTA
ncbi:Uncharacterized protein PBTT_10237 [Plasmodiophora brassicae]